MKTISQLVLVAALCTALLMLVLVLATDAAKQPDNSGPAPDPKERQGASNEAQALPPGPDNPGAASGLLDGAAYKHDWGNRNGNWILTLNWGIVTRFSKVAVSCSEHQPPDLSGFIGAATYTVHNVAVTDGSISVRLSIDWGNPIRVSCDYILIF